MADSTELDIRRFGTDLDLSATTKRGINGKAPTKTGRANMRQWLINTANTAAQELVHRGNWGADLVGYLATLDRPVTQAAMANALRRAWLRDPRIANVGVEVAPLENANRVLLRARVVYAGETETEVFETPLDLSL